MVAVRLVAEGCTVEPGDTQAFVWLSDVPQASIQPWLAVPISILSFFPLETEMPNFGKMLATSIKDSILSGSLGLGCGYIREC